MFSRGWEGDQLVEALNCRLSRQAVQRRAVGQDRSASGIKHHAQH
jgi:hypothetical protein